MLQVEIRIKGCIAENWSEWFEGLTITHVDDDTVLAGALIDQSALFGLFAKLRDLGLSIVFLKLWLRPSSPEHAEPVSAL